MNIVSVVQTALDSAAATDIERTSKQQLHRERSKRFVENLASALRAQLEDPSTTSVLSKHYHRNRQRFGLNELLFDVLVCETGTTISALNYEELTYVKKGIWAVESEFARDSREAVFDFNKLVLGAAENLLFIGPKVEDQEGFLSPLSAPADCCEGEVYVVLVPHPADWGEESPLEVSGYRRSGEEWQPIS